MTTILDTSRDIANRVEIIAERSDRQIRAGAELTTRPAVRQQLIETALAYERMTERGERFLAHAKSF
jgi:hypothetical protein